MNLIRIHLNVIDEKSQAIDVNLQVSPAAFIMFIICSRYFEIFCIIHGNKKIASCHLL